MKKFRLSSAAAGFFAAHGNSALYEKIESLASELLEQGLISRNPQCLKVLVVPFCLEEKGRIKNEQKIE